MAKPAELCAARQSDPDIRSGFRGLEGGACTAGCLAASIAATANAAGDAATSVRAFQIAIPSFRNAGEDKWLPGNVCRGDTIAARVFAWSEVLIGELLQPVHLIVLSLMFLFPTVIVGVIPFWFICKKAGYPPMLSLLNLVPFFLGTLFLVYFLAFARWKSPVEAQA